MRQLLAVAALLVLMSSPSLAAIPETMSYEGVLLDAEGVPVEDGDYDITFRVYDVDVGGSALWTELQSVPLSDGVFDVILGTVAPLSLPFDAPYWLGVTIGAEAELEPRHELAAAPYAHRAKYADEGGADADWEISGSDVYRLTGNVGIGTPTPTEKLDVAGTARVEGFEMPTGASDGYVLTSDATGAASWQPEATGDITSVGAGEGLSGGGDAGEVSLAVNTGPGLELASDAVQLTEPYQDGTAYSGVFAPTAHDHDPDYIDDEAGEIDSAADFGLTTATHIVNLNADLLDGFDSTEIAAANHNHDPVYVNEGQANSVTGGMLVPDVVSSLDGVVNDAGNIDLVEGANVTITPNDTANTITIAAAGGGGTLDDAYDYGGAGAGRTIEVDAGGVVLDATASEAGNPALRIEGDQIYVPAIEIANTASGSEAWRLHVDGGGQFAITKGELFSPIRIDNTSFNNELVLANGGVGIGTPSPVEMLEVEGGINVGNSTNSNAGTIRWSGSDFEGYGVTGWQSLTASGGGGNTLDEAYDQGGPGAGRTIVVDSGSVVLDATNNGPGVPGLIIEGDHAYEPNLRLSYGGTSSYSVHNNENQFMITTHMGTTHTPFRIFPDAPSAQMNLASTGVGLGTFTPNEKLQVVGAINLGNTANSNPGTIRWTGSDFEGRTATAWQSLTTSEGGIGGSGTASYFPIFTDTSTLDSSIMYYDGMSIVVPFSETKRSSEGPKAGRLPNRESRVVGLAVSADDYRTIWGDVTQTTPDSLGVAGVTGLRTRTAPSPGIGYGAAENNNGVTGFNNYGDAYTFGVAGHFANGDIRTGGVLGADWAGTYWGALGYKDENSDTWGVYTPNDAHIGGRLEVESENEIAAYIKRTDTTGSALAGGAVYGVRSDNGTNPGSGYSFAHSNAGVAGQNMHGSSYTFGVTGHSDLGDDVRTGGVLGADESGSMWGALAYTDASARQWGVYTNGDAHIEGEARIDGDVHIADDLFLPAGAAGAKVLMSIGVTGEAYWGDAVLMDRHNEGSTTEIGTAATQYDDAYVWINAPRQGYITVTSNVWVKLSHTAGTADVLQLNHSTSPTSMGDVYSMVLWDIPSGSPTDTDIDRTFTVQSTFPVTSSGIYSYYLVGRMSAGQNSGDMFWYAQMTATYHSTSAVPSRHTPDAEEIEKLKLMGVYE